MPYATMRCDMMQSDAVGYGRDGRWREESDVEYEERGMMDDGKHPSFCPHVSIFRLASATPPTVVLGDMGTFDSS